jgi:hypothetical protein
MESENKTSKFVYPPEFASNVINELHNWHDSDPRHNEIPPDEMVSDAIEVAYHASMLAEESRPVRFSLYLALPNTPRDVTKPGFIATCQFVESVDFKPENIKKLAFAADPMKCCILLEYDYGKSQTKIAGIVNHGEIIGRLNRGEVHQVKNVISRILGVRVCAYKPGFVYVYNPFGTIIGCLKGGTEKKDHSFYWDENLGEAYNSIFSDEIKDRVKDDSESDHDDVNRTDSEKQIIKEIAEDLKNLKGKLRYTKIGLVEVPVEECKNWLNSILANLSDKATGGTLIVLQSKEQLEKYKDYIDTKYMLGNSYLNSLWLRVLHDRKTTKSADLELQKFYEDNSQYSIQQYIEMIADFASIDGATIIDKTFSVHGFGVKLHPEKASKNKSVKFLDGYTNAEISEHVGGTRHQSAMKFCALVEKSLVFVLSQDGGVKMFHNDGEKVLVFEDIDIGSFNVK